MAFVSVSGLKQLLFRNCIELKFERRCPKGNLTTRRMFCVGAYPNFHNNPFLASAAAQTTLRYRYPKGFPPYPPQPFYNTDAKNIVITWDIFMQDYRAISMDQCNVIRGFPIDTDEKINDFWEYFIENLQNMTPQAKEIFMKK